jgi:peptide/nickel transport system permease protein
MRSRELWWGIGILAVLVAAAAAAPLLAPYESAEQLDPAAAMYRPPGTVLQAVHLAGGGWRLADRVERTASGLRLLRRGRVETLPAAGVTNLTGSGVADRRVFVLGSDKFGRDLLSRTLHGARVSLGVSLGAVALALLVGVSVGATAALGGTVADLALMRLVDACMSFPPLFLVIVLAAFLRPGLTALVLILAALSWMQVSRLMRAELLTLRRREFVVAARAVGQHPFAIFWRHLLPHALTPVLIQATLLVGILIGLEAALSFLGLGVQPPTPSWGNIIAEGQVALLDAWWISVFPGAALALTIVGCNLVGEGLRDALDPQTRWLTWAPPSGALAPLPEK